MDGWVGGLGPAEPYLGSKVILDFDFSLGIILVSTYFTWVFLLRCTMLHCASAGIGGRFLIIVSGFGGEEPLMLQMDCAMYSYMTQES